MLAARRNRIAATGAPDGEPPDLAKVLASHRVTLQGGFVLVYDQGRHVITSFEAPPESSVPSIIPWLPEKAGDPKFQSTIPLPVRYPEAFSDSAQRNDEPVVRIAGQDYALGKASTPSGKLVVAALPMPQGLSQTTARIRQGAAEYWGLFRSRNSICAPHSSSCCC